MNILEHLDVVKRHRFLSLMVGIIILPIWTRTANASDVIFDNLSPSATSSVNISDLFYQAQSFRTGGTDTFLDQVSLNLSANNGTAGTLVVQLYDNLYTGENPGPPGDLVATLLDPVNLVTGVSIFTPSTSTTLLANKTYWVSAYVTDNSLPSWMGTYSAPTIGTSAGDNMFQIQSGQWMGSGDPALNLQMQVVVETVPEPREASLLILAGGLLVAANR